MTKLIYVCLCVFRMQFRFGWFEWSEVHGQSGGEPYEVYLAADEYLTAAKLHSGWLLNFIHFNSNYHEYTWWNATPSYETMLGERLAYMEGKTFWFYGPRVADIKVYETRCYN